jgi:hypothetical protein
MHWKITAATFSVKIQLNTKFNQHNWNTFGENNIHMEAKTKMTSHFIDFMTIQSLYAHNTIQSLYAHNQWGETGIRGVGNKKVTSKCDP